MVDSQKFPVSLLLSSLDISASLVIIMNKNVDKKGAT